MNSTKYWVIIFWCVFITVDACTAVAQMEQPKAAPATAKNDNAGGWMSLFNGTNLDGWEVKAGFFTYRVEDGAIVGKTVAGSLHTYLCRMKEFGDFELTFEVKHDTEKLLAGVLIRSKIQNPEAEYGGRVNGPRIWTTANVTSADPVNGGLFLTSPASTNGEISFNKWKSPDPAKEDFRVTPLPEFKVGDWNRYRVLAVGSHIQTWINDQSVADITNAEMYQKYPRGMISLLVHGVGKADVSWQVRWRNIRIRPIKQNAEK